MIQRRIIGTAIGVLAMGLTSGLITKTAFAAAPITAGLVALSVQGVGTGSLATSVSSCGTLACKVANNCDCLTGSDTLVGNQGFAKGTLGFSILVDLTETALITSDFGSCDAATGTALLSNPGSKSTVTMDVSGLACSTESGADVFNGTYVVVKGTGKYSSSSGGTGAINGSQNPAGGLGSSQATVTGSLQPTAP